MCNLPGGASNPISTIFARYHGDNCGNGEGVRVRDEGAASPPGRRSRL